MKYGMNVKNIKQRNKSLILYLLNDLGDISRKELSKRTGLTPAAVTKLTAELIDGGYIRENGTVECERSGRREVLLTLRLDDKNILGVNAEKNCITFSLCNLSGRVKAQDKMPFSEDLDEVISFGQNFLARSGQHVMAVGVCIIGSPAEEYGVWKEPDLQTRFENAFQVATFIENNVRAFAEAELLFGDITDSSSVLFFKWGPGVGSSIIADGKVFSGNDSGVAEIGHYIVREGGRTCRCGRKGCLETEVSSDAILAEAEEMGEHIELSELATSDSKALETIIDEKLRLVAPALLNTATIFNAKEVVLFGTVFSREGVADRLNEIVSSYYAHFKRAKISVLNEKRDYIGAVAVCLERLFFRGE